VRGGGFKKGNQGGALQLRLSVFKVWSFVAGQSEVARFGGGTVGIRRRGRRAMTCGAHLSARRGEVGAPTQHLGLLGQARKAAAQEGVGRRGRLG
jgi:hypothetical protein